MSWTVTPLPTDIVVIGAWIGLGIGNSQHIKGTHYYDTWQCHVYRVVKYRKANTDKQFALPDFSFLIKIRIAKSTSSISEEHYLEATLKQMTNNQGKFVELYGPDCLLIQYYPSVYLSTIIEKFPFHWIWLNAYKE